MELFNGEKRKFGISVQEGGMKNRLIHIGIFLILAVVGLSAIACDNGSAGGGEEWGTVILSANTLTMVKGFFIM